MLLAHGGAGDWDDYALLILAPVVIAAVLWVTRRQDDDEAETPSDHAGHDDAGPV
jgi:hypothetical protein